MTSKASQFSADWLALREPVDHRSRAASLLAPLRHHLLGRGRTPALVVDLGAGSGSNQRYLAQRLGVPAHWTLLDQNIALLDRASLAAPAGTSLVVKVADLSLPLPPALGAADLVTASALLDLASEEWIGALCRTCARAQAAVLVALTIDGRVQFESPEPLDERMGQWIEQDQHRDKGLGVACGGRASDVLEQTLARLGYQVMKQRSDWVLGAADAALARAWILGWQEAALRQCPREAPGIEEWTSHRLGAAGKGGTIQIGHLDLLGLPPTGPSEGRSA